MTSSFNFSDRHLYLCIGLSDSISEIVRGSLDGGVDVLQLREKRAEAQPIIAEAISLHKIASQYQVPFIINDRVDIAQVISCDGVHLGQGDITPKQAREMLGNDIIIGRSTHNTIECDAAQDEPVDYISAGPIRETPTKPGRPGTGLEYIQYAQGTSKYPVFVTGGITPQHIDELMPLGVHHFVVVRFIVDASDAFKAASALRQAIDNNL